MTEPDGLYVANVNPGHVGTQMCRSLVDLIQFDTINGVGLWRGNIWHESGANVSKGRNSLVERFLQLPDGEWLLFIDSDMVFPPDTHVRLVTAARYAEANIMGGLCVMVGELGPIPTLYQHDTVIGSDAITRVQFDYQEDQLLQVAATGGACLLVHRSVLERMRDHIGHDMGWFSEEVVLHPDTGKAHWISEDIMFCLRAGELGERIFVDCTFEIGHAKHGRIWYPSDIRKGIGQVPRRIVAVVPTITDDLAQATVAQLRGQTVDEIIICDNGLEHPERLGDVTLLECRGQGIHEMWNAGIRHVLEHTLAARTDVAFLNDDLHLGEDCLRLMSRELAADSTLVATSANYDGRDGPALIDVDDICANKYDGTGGLAGFAFMLRGEWLTSGYRFPEDMKWWCGDNHLIVTLKANSTPEQPKRAAIVTAARVEHLNGGGNSGGWDSPEMKAQLDADLAAFERHVAQLSLGYLPEPARFPFPHLTVDGAWPDELLRRVADEFPDPDDARWVRHDIDEERKLGGREDMWGPATRELFDLIGQSAAKLSRVFGIPDLTMETVGGGYHLIPPGGRLEMHTDFTKSPDSGLYRRLNLMIYLNEDWDDPGGHLLLGDSVDITPEFNRTVVFATSNESWHGHPIPADRWRKSIAAYFFSPEPPQGWEEKGTTFARNPYAGIVPVEGGSVEAGRAYHDIPGVLGPAHRPGTAKRVAHFAPHLGVIAGRSGLDIGCSVGGVSLELARFGAAMTGLDWDEKAVELANGLADRLGVDAMFHRVDLTDDSAWCVLDAPWDFAVWLSQWMWLAKQIGHDRAAQRLSQVSEQVPVLVFETAQGPGDGMAGSDQVVGPEGVRQLLVEHTFYRQVLDIGPADRWEGDRHVFVCRRDPQITGTVTGGYGAATRDVEAGVYGDLGYDPFPGTLNLRVTPGMVRSLVHPWRTVDYADIERHLWPARVDDVDCHLMTHTSDPTVVEVIAPVRLRDRFTDGDTLTIHAR